METHIGPRKVGKPLVLYGKGKLGKLAVEIFNELKIPICGIIDSECINSHIFKSNLIAVCIATIPFTSILGKLTFLGFTDIVPVWDIIEAYPEINIHNGWFVGIQNDISMRNVIQVKSRLTDEKSQTNYDNFFAWRCRNKCYPEYTILKPSASYLDLPSTLVDIRKRQHVGISRIERSNTPDIIYIHAEGYELQTVEQNMPLFIKYRPEIIVACYHNRDGLWKIQKTLMDNLIGYNFFFDIYAYQGQAAYFSCRPKT